MPRAAVWIVVLPRTVSNLTPAYSQATVPSPGLIPTTPAVTIWYIRLSGQQIGACCSEPPAAGARYEPFQTTFKLPTLLELICLSCENNVLEVSPPGSDQLSVIGVSPAGRYAFALSPGATRGAVRDADAKATAVAATSPAVTTKYNNLRIFANPPQSVCMSDAPIRCEGRPPREHKDGG